MSIKTLMVLNENNELFDPRDLGSLLTAAREAENAGVDAVSVTEHIVLGPAAGAGPLKLNPRDYDGKGNQDPATTSLPSSVALLGAVIASTTTIGVHAGAILPVLRHPLNMAKDLATLDLLSRGRFVVWPTVSWHQQEYEALNVPFGKRGKMLDEQLEIWRRAWSETPVSYEGNHYRFQDVFVVPKPWRPAGPPIWITGDGLHDAALRRLVKYGSAFVPLSPLTADDHLRIKQAFEAAERDPTTLDFLGIIAGSFDGPRGIADIDKALQTVPPQIASGATIFAFKPSQFIERPEQLSDLCRHIVGEMKAMA